MPLDLTVPPWLSQYALAWKDRLYLNAWDVTLRIAICVNDDPEARALCEQWSDCNMARVTFRADIEDVKEWRITVIHELIHVAHSRIDRTVECAILPELASAAHDLAKNIYVQQLESYVAFLARTLYAAAEALDYPEEGKVTEG